MSLKDDDMRIDVVWSCYPDDGEEPLTFRHTTMLEEWADSSSNACSVASEIAADFFNNAGVFGDNFGDSDSGNVLIEIHEPSSIAGKYDVDLERSIMARARRIG